METDSVDRGGTPHDLENPFDAGVLARRICAGEQTNRPPPGSPHESVLSPPARLIVPIVRNRGGAALTARPDSPPSNVPALSPRTPEHPRSGTSSTPDRSACRWNR